MKEIIFVAPKTNPEYFIGMLKASAIISFNYNYRSRRHIITPCYCGERVRNSCNYWNEETIQILRDDMEVIVNGKKWPHIHQGLLKRIKH